MAFLKFAHANILKTEINFPGWDLIRRDAHALGSAFATREASRIVLTEYKPSDYMLTHSTIVASVDTENGPGQLGRQLESGFEVNRKYADYYVTPKTNPFINNNFDCWERKLLLSSFRTFIGGSNFVEHLQIPEMNKGRILDAVARDIGDSVYIDILVATHRKHKALLDAIRAKRLSTLSMGCTVTFTTCTQCGNVAVDDTQFCHHIRYLKGNTFLDGLGQTRKISELCGHVSEEPGSVRFKEASWVGNPAFTGAVLHDILTPEEANVYAKLHADRVQVAFSQPPSVFEPGLMSRAARALDFDLKAFDLGQGQESEFGGADAPKEDPQEDDPLKKTVGDLVEYLKGQAVQEVRKQLKPEGSPENRSENLNDTLIKQAAQYRSWGKIALALHRSTGSVQAARRMLLGLLLYKRGGWRQVKASGTFSGREILAISKVLDALQGTPKIAGEDRIYRTVLAVGGSDTYEDQQTYLAACRRVLGRDLTGTERQCLIVKGKLFDLGC